MFSLISVANVKSDLWSFLIADHPGDHLTAWTRNSYMEADITKNITLIQKKNYKKNHIAIMGISVRQWDYLDEGVDSHWEQLAQKIWFIELKSGENIHNQTSWENRAHVSSRGNSTKWAGNAVVRFFILVSLICNIPLLDHKG